MLKTLPTIHIEVCLDNLSLYSVGTRPIAWAAPIKNIWLKFLVSFTATFLLQGGGKEKVRSPEVAKPEREGEKKGGEGQREGEGERGSSEDVQEKEEKGETEHSKTGI